MAGPDSDSSSDDRTEAPSQFRREEFRRQGTVALSKELTSVALLFAVGGSLYVASHNVMREFTKMADRHFKFGRISDIGRAELFDINHELLKAWGWMVLPVFGVAVVAGIAVCAAQVGFYLTWEPLSPKWDRINPVNGFKRLFSSSGLIEAVKALFKMAIAGLVAWSFFKTHGPEAAHLYGKSAAELLPLTMTTLSKLFFTLLFALAALAGLDFFFQRYRLEKQMKMTRREAKDEFKLREGDPLIKSRIRSIQRRLASRRMMEEIPKADVIVTNPTHLAIALKYDPKAMEAPRVIAKGAGVIADKIRELARKNNVPLVENKPLARAMFKQLDVGEYIPRDLYKAVAQVLSYVYRLKRLTGQAV